MPKKGERPQIEQGRLGINQPPAHPIDCLYLITKPLPIYLFSYLLNPPPFAALQSLNLLFTIMCNYEVIPPGMISRSLTAFIV
jgi:hypothetical protein